MKPHLTPGSSLARIALACGGRVVGDGDLRVLQIAPLEKAGPDEITFLVNPRLLARLADCQAAAVIIGERHVDRVPEGFRGSLIVADDAHVCFARVATLLNPPAEPPPGIHPSAVVESEIPASVSVGPGAWIGPGVEIGERTVIGANCNLMGGLSIGEDSLLHPGVSIYPGSLVGKRAIIHSGAVIGSDGFGFAREKDGAWVKIPQIGRAVIGDDVEIGANTTIDCGAMEDTVIADGVKIDNLVHVAHNVRVGRHTAMAACTGIAGSVQIGERCMLGGAAMISGHLSICDDVIVSGATLIMKNILSPGVYTSSVPALEHASWMKNFSHLRHLEQTAERIRALEKRLAELEGATETPS